jgi:transcriptional regulator with XRE-family HTH domain
VIENIRVVDQSVGRRVRMMRVSRGLSQTALASQLDLTFQQLQKYEKGTNRISASKLHDIARILGVEVASFFEDAAYPERLANIVDSDMPRRIDLLIASKLSQLPEGALAHSDDRDHPFRSIATTYSDRSRPVWRGCVRAPLDAYADLSVGEPRQAWG